MPHAPTLSSLSSPNSSLILIPFPIIIPIHHPHPHSPSPSLFCILLLIPIFHFHPSFSSSSSSPSTTILHPMPRSLPPSPATPNHTQAVEDLGSGSTSSVTARTDRRTDTLHCAPGTQPAQALPARGAKPSLAILPGFGAAAFQPSCERSSLPVGWGMVTVPMSHPWALSSSRVQNCSPK